jgi:acyl-CoA thioester hydrolase
MAECSSGFRHSLSVRWGEVDQQGVVFNAHYLAYMDDAMETWLRPVRDTAEVRDWDMMLKRCTIEWQGTVRSGDRLDIDVAVSRWGRTSWDLGYVGTCERRPVFTAVVVYVSVARGTGTARETPRAIREFMGEPIDRIGALRSDDS